MQNFQHHPKSTLEQLIEGEAIRLKSSSHPKANLSSEHPACLQRVPREEAGAGLQAEHHLWQSLALSCFGCPKVTYLKCIS